jgi:signal transduction histidine kinase
MGGWGNSSAPVQAERKLTGEPAARALFITLLLAALMLPYWWLAVQWAGSVLVDPETYFTFSTTTFLIVLIIADSTFLVRYYQLRRKREMQEKTEQLRRSEDALKAANKKLKILSGITRHDIKNQLMALKGYLELIQDSQNDPVRIAEFIETEQKIADIIEHQINFTKDYEDMGVQAPEWQNVADLIRIASGELPLGEVSVDVERDDILVFADPLLAKVFYNLIDNALKHAGDQLTTIVFDAQEQDSILLMTFRDDGAGISPDVKPRLFSKGAGKNSGLGLFLAREILSLTGMTIEESGIGGRGAKFEIRVPPGMFRVSLENQ